MILFISDSVYIFQKAEQSIVREIWVTCKLRISTPKAIASIWNNLMNPRFIFLFWAKLNMKVQWPIPACMMTAYQGNCLQCLGFEFSHDSKQKVITGHIFGRKLKSGSGWEIVVYALWWSMTFNSSPGRIWMSLGGWWHILKKTSLEHLGTQVSFLSLWQGSHFGTSKYPFFLSVSICLLGGKSLKWQGMWIYYTK